MIRIKGGGYSDKGAVKPKNEDAFIFRIKNSEEVSYGLFAVSDGISTLKNSEVASSYIMSMLDKWWNREIEEASEISEKDALLDSLRNEICEANRSLIKYGMGQNIKCGATLSILLVINRTGHIFHTGDSRIYSMTKSFIGHSFEQLTEDHNKEIVVNTDKGTVIKSYLTECIGARETIRVDRSEFEIDSNASILLCTDGIYKHQAENKIAKMLSGRGNLGDICRQLVMNAIKNGETDNLTAVMLRLS